MLRFATGNASTRASLLNDIGCSHVPFPSTPGRRRRCRGARFGHSTNGDNEEGECRIGGIPVVRLIALSIVAACLIAAPLVGGRLRDTHQTRYGRETKAQSMAKATFGAGCFWGVEAAFRKVPGMVSTTVGYTGGTAPKPTYEQVCAGGTGHTESVEIVYDPTKVTYDQLLEVFLRIHDPTEKTKAQYKSVIFYHTPEQRAAAEAALKRLQDSGASRRPIVTEVLPTQTFYPAEEYHQQYYEKQGIEGDVCAK